MTESTTHNSSKTMAILSLIFGIVSILLSLFFPIIWLLLAIAGLILGILSRRREPAGQKIALAGIIVSIIGILANIGSMIAGVVIATQILNS